MSRPISLDSSHHDLRAVGGHEKSTAKLTAVPVDDSHLSWTNSRGPVSDMTNRIPADTDGDGNRLSRIGQRLF
jgi:hypothetical protein